MPDLEIYVDGASKGNPGRAGIGVVFQKDGKIIQEFCKDIGQATNNVAEYSALIFALTKAKELDAEKLSVYTDSELMFRQLTGKYKVKNEHLKPLFEQANELASSFERVEIQHVMREKNKDADRLANEALKSKPAKTVAPVFKHKGEESPSSKG